VEFRARRCSFQRRPERRGHRHGRRFWTVDWQWGQSTDEKRQHGGDAAAGQVRVPRLHPAGAALGRAEGVVPGEAEAEATANAEDVSGAEIGRRRVRGHLRQKLWRHRGGRGV
jgi:hypothetical protein